MRRDISSSSRPIPRRTHSVSLLVVDVVVVVVVAVVVVVVGTFYFRSAHCIIRLAEKEQKEEGERALEHVHACTSYVQSNILRR